ncbi:MAG TPA: MFS transporter [Acidobacteriota bacterium]|nr:MFS transporter [Acidobacteriota bacterium]
MSRPSHGPRVVLCLFFVLFLGVADNQVISPLLPAIRAQVKRSSSDMGLLFTGYSVCAGLSVLLWGPLSDVFGRKRGLIAGLLIFSLGSLISSLAADFQTLMLGRIVTGMGASMLSLNTISYAADFFPYSSRGWAMGSIMSSYFAALILGVPLGSWIGDKLGWNAVFGTTCTLALVLLMTTQFLLPGQSPGQPQSTEVLLVRQIRTYASFLRGGKTFGALLSSFCASAGMMGFLAFIGVWLHDDFGIPGKKIGLVFLASGTAALLASPLAGSLSDRIGKRVQFILSNLSLALLLFLLPNLRWGPRLFGVFAAISLAAAFRQGPMEALLTEVVPANYRGSFIALKNSFSQVGIGLAALVSGLLFEHSGYSAVCFLGALFNLAAAGGMLFFVRENRL